MENKQDLVYRIIKDRSFEKLNRERKEYLSSRYALGYCTLCNELGIEPEDQLLYEHGLVELMKKKF
ncbi:MAG: hypothetical protein Q8O03_00730 [Nanoarchaeota archaeon]|nr:hypothetical protein [Nanoarchaeota archaeon]